MKKYSGIKGELDKLVGGFFRSRPCELALTDPTHRCSGNIEWAHLKTRKYLSIRWNTFNAFSLCSSAHFWFTNNPDLFTRWIDKNYPGRIDEVNKLMQLNIQYKEWMLKELYDKLKEELT